MRTDAQQTDPATIARELWARGYSLAYIAARLGVSRTAAAELIGMARIVSRERRRGRA